MNEYQPTERDYSLGFYIEYQALRDAVEIPEGFFSASKEQRAAWAAISELRAAGEPVQLVTVAEKCQGNGVASYLAAITSGLIPIKPEDFRQRIFRQLAEDAKRRMHSLAAKDNPDLDELAGIIENARRLELEIEGELTAGPAFKRLDEIEGRQIEWLWTGRIPLGMISLCAGDPGLGKSFLVTWLASKLSVGAALPGDPSPARSGSTIYLAAEDSPAYALQPRAAKNGADLSRILVLEDSKFDISEDLTKIRTIVQKDPSVRLLIIDPLNSYLGKTDYLKDPDVRAILNPLVEFCEETKIAALAVMHLNKKTDQAGIYRIGGSIAFAGVARSILAVTQDPEDHERRLLRPIKMNYARKPDALAFRIGEDLALTFDEGTVDIGTDDPLTPPSGREALEGSFAAEWLAGHLADGPVELPDILGAAKGLHIPQSTLYRAKDRLKVRSRSSGFGRARATTWELPA